MTFRIVLAWFWVLRVTKLNLVLQQCIEAHLTRRLGQPPDTTPALVTPPLKPLEVPKISNTECEFVTGLDSRKNYDGRYLTIVNGRYVREQ